LSEITMLAVSFFWANCLFLCRGHNVNISNLEPRLDSAGQIVTAHDGNIVQFAPNGDYHFYGMSYGGCQAQGCGKGACGFQDNHNVTLFTSPDLSQGSWVHQGNVLPVDARPAGIYFRPKVVYNPNTGLYVLWVNWLASRRDFGSSAYLVATSTTPVGPFTVVNDHVQTFYATGGDFDIFVDDDGEAYIIYTSLAIGHKISVEHLASDYLSSTLNNTGPISSGSCLEAPTMFKRKGLYYALYGTCCCFCSSGDSRTALTSADPMGFSQASPRYGLGNAGHAQENYVMRVSTTSGMEYIWTGDRWNSAPDGVKDHDFQYWTRLVFNDSSTPSSGRFIKYPQEAPIYWETDGTKFHVLSCNMCGQPCDHAVSVTKEYIDGLTIGTDFTCDQLGQPIAMEQCDSFVLDMPDKNSAALV